MSHKENLINTKQVYKSNDVTNYMETCITAYWRWSISVTIAA
ncbi:hypothetical protein A2U01_0103806, partial [Trifolium medium]|nr:hypothetical protein [Trifolium medium]